jgi:hypothetical protein
VERLYREEERWEEETLRLGQEREDLAVRLSREVEEAREQTETSRTQHVEEKKLLVDSVRVLSADNARLLEEREREKQLSSKSQTELQQEFQGEVTRLQATVSSLQTELELQAREEAESEVEKVSAELERMEEQVKEVKREQVRSGMETKVEQLEKKSEKVAADNFELTLDNDGMKKTKVVPGKVTEEVVHGRDEAVVGKEEASAGEEECDGDTVVIGHRWSLFFFFFLSVVGRLLPLFYTTYAMLYYMILIKQIMVD